MIFFKMSKSFKSLLIILDRLLVNAVYCAVNIQAVFIFCPHLTQHVWSNGCNDSFL